MSRLLGAWRLPLRLAWREARRARGRSALVLVMIALPVLAVTAADVVTATSQVTGGEAIERRLGTADARVSVQPGISEVTHGFDPDSGFGSSSGVDSVPPRTLDDVRSVLGSDLRAVEVRTGSISFETDEGVGSGEATEVDLADPLSDGLFELTSGRLPADADEVVVNSTLASRGPGVGERLTLSDGTAREIVGTVESTSSTGYPLAVGPAGALELPTTEGQHEWLVSAGPVSWAQVRELNALGATVASRAVITDPPPDSELPAEVRDQSALGGGGLAVVVLIVVMVLIEVVLLAGPAFAVGARRQSRALALIAASGGTPRQARRVVLASGVVLGALGALVGVVTGLLVARALLPLLQTFSTSRFGPYDVPWLHLVGIASFGMLSALLAAVVPAHIASRQDVVAVLAGRRGDARPSRRSPVIGLVLLGAGVAGAVLGARQPAGGETWIAGAAILAVLGMILVVPVVVVAVASLARRLPLSLRFAARDAARHRTRTVPAVAAVAATVAGVVALGIALSSDAAENEATYLPSLPMGTAALTTYAGDPDWTAMRAVLTRTLPGAEVEEVRGIPETAGDVYRSFEITVPGRPDPLLSSYGSTLGSSVLVSDGPLPPLVALGERDTAAATAALAAGRAVVFVDRVPDADRVKVATSAFDAASGREDGRSRTVLPALFLARPAEAGSGGPQALLPTAALARLDLQPATVALALPGGDIDPDAEKDATEAVAALSPDTSLYVERGYQADEETLIIQLVLGGLGAVLMLGGTLTATFLALSDARPDLATLSAVGASPRTRRAVAASYALVVGVVGAVMGAVVGLIPGIAVAFPLTRSGPYLTGSGTGFVSGTPDSTGPYLDIPWLLLLVVVVGLPLLTAAVVGLTARSRLPLVARLD